MLLAEVVYREDLLSLAPSTAVAKVDAFVYSVSVAVAVLELISAALTKHEGDDF